MIYVESTHICRYKQVLKYWKYDGIQSKLPSLFLLKVPLIRKSPINQGKFKVFRMILGFDSGCPLPSLGSPRFDEEAVNRAKGGRSPRWIYSQSFSNKKLYSQSTQFFAFAPLIHNNIVFIKATTG